MHANHFRRLALAQGLLPSEQMPEQPSCAPVAEQDGLSDAAAGVAAPPTPDALH